MKKIALLFMMVAALTLVSCGGKNTKKAAAAEETKIEQTTENHGNCSDCPNKGKECGSGEECCGKCADDKTNAACCEEKACPEDAGNCPEKAAEGCGGC